MSSPKHYNAAPGIFGGANYYDDSGNLVGYSTPGIFGGAEHYDAAGNHVGSSVPGVFGEAYHYNEDGECSCVSVPALPFVDNVLDTNGNQIGTVEPEPLWGALSITIVDRYS